MATPIRMGYRSCVPFASSAGQKKIFISYSGKEYPRMEQLIDRLRDRGHLVFVDRQGNHLGDPVTSKLEQELLGSTICLVYYSQRYAERHACQSELMQVLVADQREGGPARTLVINPEPAKAHIHPAVLRDQIYLPDDQSEAALKRIVDEVELRLSQLTGAYQGIDFTSLPRTVGGRPGVTSLVRRYGAMWELHTALHSQRYALTHQATNGIAVLTGLRGAGKTTLTDDYLLHFAHEYDLVVRIDLSDVDGTAAKSALAEAGARIEAGLRASSGQVLITIGNIPAGVPHDFFTAILDGSDVLVLLVTEHPEYATLGTRVLLAGLTDDEARALFNRLHPFDRNDGATLRLVNELMAAVENHALAIALVAAAATTQRGLTTLTELVGRVLDGSSGTTDRLAGLVTLHVEAVDGYELAVLRLMAACGPAPMPVRLIRDMVTTLGMEPSRVPDVLDRLRAKMIVVPNEGLWSLHALFRPAVRRSHGEAAVDWLAAACAEHLAGVLEAGSETHAIGEWTLLVRHARYLVDRTTLSPATTNTLLASIAKGLREDGQQASAARYLDRLLASGAAEPSLLVDAASDHYEVGEYQDVAKIAENPPPSCPARERVLLACLGAAALDAMGDFIGADRYWRQAVDPATSGLLPETDRFRIRILWLRGRRLRGIVQENLAELREILEVEARLPEHFVQVARLEAAHLWSVTGDQRRAREHARRVVDFHARKAQQHHPIAVEAEYVLATAELRLHFTDLKVDQEQWTRAEAALRRILRQREEDLGARNVDVLATKVSIDLAVVQQGRPKEALAGTDILLPVLVGKLDEHHPIVLREHYVRGLACSQLGRFDDAVEALDRAHRGQLTVLGIAHPETLQTQFELAMALKLQGLDKGMSQANSLLDQVNERAPKVVGRRTDLPWQALTAATLARYAPAWLLRQVHKQSHQDKW
jgi:tetratricopeptide (TPR) repeat protein